MAVPDDAGGPAPAARWLPRYLLLSVIWGSSFALMKVAVQAGVPPLWVALGRCLFGAVALLVGCAAGRLRLPGDRRTWGHALVVAILVNAAPFALLAYGETRVSSVLAGIWNAATPLSTLLFVVLLLPQERLTRRRLAGLLAGFVGVLVVPGIWQGVGGATLVGGLACLAATACYGAGFTYTRRFFSGRAGSATALSAVQVSCATLALAVVTPLVSGLPRWPGWPALVAVVVLGVLGTGLAFVLNMGVIRIAGATVAATVTYLTPLWSTLLGALLLAEPLTWHTVVGGVLVVAGVLLARPSRPAPRPAATDPAPDTAPGPATDRTPSD